MENIAVTRKTNCFLSECLLVSDRVIEVSARGRKRLPQEAGLGMRDQMGQQPKVNRTTCPDPAQHLELAGADECLTSKDLGLSPTSDLYVRSQKGPQWPFSPFSSASVELPALEGKRPLRPLAQAPRDLWEEILDPVGSQSVPPQCALPDKCTFQSGP